jgi:hypothetical protein
LLKKVANNLAVYLSYLNFVPLRKNGPWCNGNTPDFGSVILGSNPGGPTKIEQQTRVCCSF